MIIKSLLLLGGLLPLGAGGLWAQNSVPALTTSEGRANHLFLSKDTLELGYAACFGNVAVTSNLSTSYQIVKADADDWLSYQIEDNGGVTFYASYYYDAVNPRFADVQFADADGNVLQTLVVKQLPNTSVTEYGDTKLTIQAGIASSTQSGYNIEKSFDDDETTLYHSVYSGGSFPFTLTYTLKAANHVDYMVYTPRSDGNINGCWGEIVVSYATAAAPSTYTEIVTTDCGSNNGTSTISFGENGIDNVLKVKIVIKSAGSLSGSAFASCAEVGFYQKDQKLAKEKSTYFADDLCTTLNDGVDISAITTPYLRQLAENIQSGSYSTTFRVGEFNCYLTRATLRDQLKNSNPYDLYENPTGIYFEAGDKLIIFASGIGDNYPVQLCIKNFSNANDIATEGQPESYYTLRNGANLITASNRGNGYVSYFSDDYTNAPTIKLHFALATESGYFDPRKHTNAQYKEWLANAKSDIFDFYTQRMHVAAPVANLKKVCPENAEKLAAIYDSVIYREREIMGILGDDEPTNHQFAKPVASGMFANVYGANAAFGSFNEWVNPESFGFWGLGHELGHNNQISPGFKWAGCGETTNNIYASWVEHKLGAANAYGTGYHRLEDESSGIDTYTWTRGGRFEAYLEEGVRKGVSWQLQDGPDYNGTEATSVTVAGQDANGNSTGSVTTTSRNYDHFLKVIPFWQLSLYTKEVGAAPDAWGNVIGTYRTDFNSTTYNTNGKQQIEFMRRFCEQTQINFLPFFEKAGILKTISAYIEDYTPGWLIINQTMIDNLKTEIAAKNYAECPAGLNFINAYNWQRFRDKVALTAGTVGNGCTVSGTDRIQVDNDVWAGAVGYETYDSSDNLLHLSMFGLGDSQMSSRYTYVLFPSTASYIMAVGYDGTKVKIYQK